MKKFFPLIFVCAVSLLLVGCGKQKASETCPIGSGSVACGTTSGIVDHSDFTGTLNSVLIALKNEDFATLATFVGSQGIRFSPYGHINTGTDVILDKQIIENALTISRSYVWGTTDGKGDPIDLGIGQYFEKFVNDADYAHAPTVLYNTSIQRGNTINNIAQVYQGKSRVEYYFSGFDAQYEGMDWKSLTLVFEHVGGQWYIIGVIHGSRTI
ncbi:MAG: hypothetical protein NT085_04670 [candidate division SR1 bacterium]|nr:hypothetical protein [candidate division SR1 bacterium]